MTAGTVVITGGILATVILLSIIAVLCYCRLQYYCCKKEGSEDEEQSESHATPHFACNACTMQASDGSALINPQPLPPEPGPTGAGTRNYCPTCSPYSSPFYIRTADEMRNGGERITYTPTRYEFSSVNRPSKQGLSMSRETSSNKYRVKCTEV